MFEDVLFLILSVVGIILIILVIYDIIAKDYVIKKLRETNKALFEELIEFKEEWICLI